MNRKKQLVLDYRADDERDVRDRIEHELSYIETSILLFLNKLNALTVNVDGTTTLLNRYEYETQHYQFIVKKKAYQFDSLGGDLQTRI